MLRFASLGSGSEGNGLLVESGDTCVLVDCGFSIKETVRRLARLGREPRDVAAILVTHEHGDHLGGVGPFARRYGTTVWASAGTAHQGRLDVPELCLLNTHQAFSLGNLEIRPFPVPHDAREPCQFVIADERHALGILTDLGSLTPWVRQMLDGVDALLLECNHDLRMLAQGRYPASLKARVGGAWGHLNNAQSAELLASLTREKLQQVVAAHLSRENNRAELAQAALAEVLDGYDARLSVADQDDGFTWIELE